MEYWYNFTGSISILMMKECMAFSIFMIGPDWDKA